MNGHSATMRDVLATVDVARMRKLWAHISPHLPCPEKDDDVVVAIHMARTQAASIAFRQRAYSHRWLTERGYASQMPDALRPAAERMYPRIVEAVGIAVHSSSPLMKPVAGIIQKAMSDAVEDAFASGRKDPVFVQNRMREARESTVRKLLGRI